MNMRTPIAYLSILLATSLPVSLWAAGSSDYREAGEALYRAGQYEKALVYLNNAVKADQQDSQAFEDLGDTYSKLNNLQEARNAYQKSLELNPNNPALRAQLNNLGGGANADTTTPRDSTAPPQAGTDDNLTPKIEPWHKHPGAISSTNVGGGIHPTDRSKIWIKADLGYNYSLQTDLVNSANTLNNGAFVPGNAISGSTSYAGSSLASNSGLEWGGELGFLINPNFGIGIGARVIRTNDYTADVTYDTGDSESLILQPRVVPITLDLYFFLPDSGGRFFISGGAGYYAGIVHVDQTTTWNNFFGTPNGSSYTDNWAGDLTSSTVGFQVAIGRDFAVTRRLGIELFARGRYAKITNFRGTLYDSNDGAAYNYGLAASNSGPALVDADTPSYINSAYNERYATIDFTGFEVGAALVFYHF